MKNWELGKAVDLDNGGRKRGEPAPKGRPEFEQCLPSPPKTDFRNMFSIKVLIDLHGNRIAFFAHWAKRCY